MQPEEALSGGHVPRLLAAGKPFRSVSVSVTAASMRLEMALISPCNLWLVAIIATW